MEPKKQKRDQAQEASPQANQPPESIHDDPLREESTDFRAPGEKFEVLPPGENLDLNRMDQPRTNLESLPTAHKEKTSVHELKKTPGDRDKEPQKRVA